ncbi:MAG: 2-phospho-L-lactate transferase [Chloroflexota bacterium]|nr:2-phospho-L-lactate transferase [Chloroflexota bacterium]
MPKQIVTLLGGVGGAKLALGLSKLLDPNQLVLVVNTGDDQEFYGLHVSPDLDTVMYTLAGISNQDTGWGIEGETFYSLHQMKEYGQDNWFNLGDKDLATHITRTHLLRDGDKLSKITLILSRALGVRNHIIPMTDGYVRTVLSTDIGLLNFQEYFVKFRCVPKIQDIRFDVRDNAQPSKKISGFLNTANVLIIAPSNPYLSIDPILAVPGFREMVQSFKGPRIAVSPIIGGEALRGPAAKLMIELGIEPSCVSVARKYQGICDIFVIDKIDESKRSEIESLGFQVKVMNTVMVSEEDKIKLGQGLLDIVE